MAQVILLDSNWRFHKEISLKKAMNLICRGKVEVIKYTTKKMHEDFFVPAVIRLIKAIRKYYGRAVKWSKNRLFIRDEYTCQYCGTQLPEKKLTIDHVIPQAKGGKTEWENCVACCDGCNNLKGDKTLNEVGYVLRNKPIQPTIMEFTQKYVKVFGLDKVLKDLGVY
jgi:5-methylcytosine-specific restriction endonuclease McrA